MLKPNSFHYISILLVCLLITKYTGAQCTGNISNFPYNEGFETNDGNWMTNGFQSDWAWGTPSKPVINKAGGGSNCWVTGGLTTSFYNNGEASWLQSPCFDFSSLQYPYITFKVWWETENGYDGAGFQYSTDNGSSWNNIGSASGTTNCLNNNWFNSQSISYLSAFTSSGEGWSGNVQSPSGNCSGGGGSGGWLVASQAMPLLAGKSNVIFRFTFGAGTQCNNFDGFAIDDINIGEAPPNNGEISYTCASSNNVDFIFTTDLCPTNYSWDFNDVASGTNNASSLSNPSHIFSAPGIYRVSLSVSSVDNAPFITTKTVTILGLNTEVVTPISCGGGATGAVNVTVSGSPGPFTYVWDTSPQQTANNAINLSPGTYSVNVIAANSCDASASIELVNPAITVDTSVQQPGCLFEKGKISLTVAGGLPPYSYTWSPSVSAGPDAANLNPGLYVVTINDSRPCSQQLNFTIANLLKPNLTVTALEDANCNEIKKGSAAANVTGGTAPYTYLWNTIPTQTKETANNLQQGIYSITVTDANGCTDTKSVSISIGGICNDIYFPNAFTPDAAQNNSFGPLGNVAEMGSYILSIYNRFGEQVFSSNNPFIRWGGMYKGARASAGVYVWYSKYTYKRRINKSRYGTTMIIR